MELISRRMQVRRTPLRLAVAASVRARGGLFVGFGSFLARELPFDMIQMSCFEWMKSRVEGKGDKNGKKRALRARDTAALGGIAGAFTGLITTPFDVSRTASVCSKSLGLEKMSGMRDVSRLMFRGAVPRMVEIGFGGIVYFSCIQATLRFLDDKEKMDKVLKI
jgi:solute carrier family 25 S-adenosylmethionine transporter 26